MNAATDQEMEPLFNAAQLGVLAHLYRGEMYRSKIWRTRLDTTTNWAVATTGIALSLTFSNPQNSPLPLLLIGLLVLVFWGVEARRYRFFDIWRTRVRLLEVCFYAPILRGRGPCGDTQWNEILARDYDQPHFHINFREAAGRRLRRNYVWLFAILGVSYLTKIGIHPTPTQSLSDLWERAAVGPIPGQIILLLGFLSYIGLFLLAVITLRRPKAAGRVTDLEGQVDPITKLDIQV